MDRALATRDREVTSLNVIGLKKSWGDIEVLKNISLSVASGEFVSLLGPSGCGKTTILRIIAGLIEPSSGIIRVGDADITFEPAHRRQIGLVFQSYALFPHLNVHENVAFGLRRRGIKGAAADVKTSKALERVRLSHLAQRYPRELSGGQQQRVALARATVIEPRLLLLDEPLSNLDAVLRAELGMEIKRLQRELGITTIFVTHDQIEALTMSDRICLLNHGNITQLAKPEQIYQRPATTFVATFMGRANILRANVRHAGGGKIAAVLGSAGGEITGLGEAAAGSDVIFALRQQAVNLRPLGEATGAGENRLSGTVSFCAFAGATRHYAIQLDNGPEVFAEATAGPGAAPAFSIGDRIIASWRMEDLVAVVEDEVFQ
jgi:putative spermidine/putrescine transport system ATP-binding protein